MKKIFLTIIASFLFSFVYSQTITDFLGKDLTFLMNDHQDFEHKIIKTDTLISLIIVDENSHLNQIFYFRKGLVYEIELNPTSDREIRKLKRDFRKNANLVGENRWVFDKFEIEYVEEKRKFFIF